MQFVTRDGRLLAAKGMGSTVGASEEKEGKRFSLSVSLGRAQRDEQLGVTGPGRRFGPKDVMFILYYFIYISTQ